MRATSWFGAGLVTAVVLTVLIGFVSLKTIAGGFRADAEPTAVETWAARTARESAIPVTAKKRKNPIPITSEVLGEARAHWADHCAACHANDGSGKSDMGQNMYPQAPDMRHGATQQMTDGELFYIIQNGIRLSGMPAWGSEHSGEEDSWKLVNFVRHLPQLSASELQEMETLNPKSPHDIEEENQEKQFLNGESPGPSSHSHRQH